MESLQEAKKCIAEANNICIIPSQTNEPESLTSALALFYTLKELHKNVNPIMEDLPEKLSFLTPSLDFISSPKNFVISIPRAQADVSQIYYEKNEDNLKIYLTLDKGTLKKDQIYFYFSEAKPDLVITLGIQDFQKELEGKLDSFGFLFGCLIINIDNNEQPFGETQGKNKKFGTVNIIENTSLSEIVLGLITSIDENVIKKNIANCLLSGLIMYYKNFTSIKTNDQVFKISSDLIKKGANHQEIIDNIYKTNPIELHFLQKIFQNLKSTDSNNTSFSILDSDDFQYFSEKEAESTVEKIKTMGMQGDLLVLWKSHASPKMVKGFFCSKKPHLLNKIADNQAGTTKDGWVFLEINETDIDLAKNKILHLINMASN